MKIRNIFPLIVCLLVAYSLISSQTTFKGNVQLRGNGKGHNGGGFSIPSSFTWEQVPSPPEYLISIAKTGTKIFAGTRSGIPTTYLGGVYYSNNGGAWTKINAGLSSRISICSDWPTPCSSAPTGGTFTLTYNGQTTSALASNASNATIQSALEGLSTVGTGNIIVSDGPLGQSATLTFQGARANDDPTDITLTSSLTGTTPGGMIRGPRLVTQLWETPTGALLANVRNNLNTELFRLASGGTTWQKISSRGIASVWFDYTSDASGNILATNLVGTDNIFRSTDDGVTFSAFSTVDAACYADDSRPISIYRAPTSIAPNNTIFVGPHNDALHYSTDNGATWACMGAPAGSVFGGVNSVKISGSGQPIITGQYGQVNVHTGTWSSLNTWNFQYLTGNNETTHDIILLSNGDLIIHGKRPYRSTNGGISWTLDDNGIPAGDINNPDGGAGTLSVASHTIVVGPDKKLYLAIVNQASGWGIYRTTVAVVP